MSAIATLMVAATLALSGLGACEAPTPAEPTSSVQSEADRDQDTENRNLDREAQR